MKMRDDSYYFMNRHKETQWIWLKEISAANGSVSRWAINSNMPQSRTWGRNLLPWLPCISLSHWQSFPDKALASPTSRLYNSTLPKIWWPTPVFLPGESPGQRSLVGYTVHGATESDTTERLTLSLSTGCRWAAELFMTECEATVYAWCWPQKRW